MPEVSELLFLAGKACAEQVYARMEEALDRVLSASRASAPAESTTPPIDPEALADAILRSVRTWGKATFKGDPRNQRAVIRDTIKDYLKEKQE